MLLEMKQAYVLMLLMQIIKTKSPNFATLIISDCDVRPIKSDSTS